MLVPSIGSRREKASDLAGFRIDRCDLASLGSVTKKTCPGKIGLVSDTAMFGRNYVVRFMRQD